MERIHRDRADIPTAISSELKRAHVARATGHVPAGATPPDRTGRGPGSVVERLVYGAAKPFLRPFIGPLRRVIVGPLEDEVRVDRRRIEEVWQMSQAAGRRVAVPIGPDRVLVRTVVGYVLCSTDDLGTLAVLIERGDLEPGTRLLIERLIEPGDTFVDVGANLGLHTLAAARAMRGEGRVHAFEPYEPTVRLLRESLVINGLAGFVEVHQAAVADGPGEQRLFLGSVSGHHSLFPLPEMPGVQPASVDVPVVQLDAVLGDDSPVDLMKVDVEGAELQVIDGARSAIERSPEIALIVEFGPSHLARAGQSPGTWFERFDRLGLEFREIDAESGRVYERSVESLAQVESVNLLFARPNSRAWQKAAR